MATLDLAGRASAQQRAPRHRPFAAELRATLALAAPIVATNLTQHGLVATDVILLGRIGASAVAAGALASSLYFVLFIGGIGLASAVAPLIADARGAMDARPDSVRRTFRAGFWAVTLVSVPLTTLLWHTEGLLRLIGEPEALAADAGLYMRALLWSLWPSLVFMVLRVCVSALERPGWALLVSAVALPVNLGLALFLAFEAPGCLGMGLAGVGLATTVTAFLMAAALALVVVWSPSFRRHRLFAELWRFDAARLMAVLRLGLPMAATGLAEAGLFEAAVLGMGLFGTAQLAAHAVTIQIAALCFMVPNGVAQAATVRVGLAYGAGDGVRVRRAGIVALALAFVFMSACALLQVSVPRILIGLFLDLDQPGNAVVLPYAVGFLGLAAVFAVSDGIQSVTLGMLRGLQDTRVPMLFAIGGYWGLGVPLGIALAWGAGYEGYGIWLGFCAGLLVVASLLVWRWRRLTAVAACGT